MNRDYRRNRSEVLYVYDRVCPKKVKKRQINRAYQLHRERQNPTGNTNRFFGDRTSEGSSANPTSERPFGTDFAYQQRQRARANPYKQRNSRAYQYRPNSYGGNAEYGGEAVKSRPLKLIMDKLVNLFESLEERGRRDEAIAKEKAIAWKKLTEYKHIFVTALVVLLISALFVTLVYKVFFVIEDVDISGSDIYSSEEILASAGFEEGDNLYSFAAEDAENTITFLCPYIKTAEVERTVPKSVAIALTDDTAVYWANIWGDTVKLSSGLRVLEVAEEADTESLIELVLPPVKYSVAGRVIEFSDKKGDRFIRSVLTELEKSSLAEAGMVDEVDLSNEYDITVESGGRYLLRLGDESDCDLKLRMAYKTMTDRDFDTLLPARIDLTEVGKAIVKPDAGLTLD